MIFDKLFLFLIIFSLLLVTVFGSITPKEPSFEATGIFAEGGSAKKYFSENHENLSTGIFSVDGEAKKHFDKHFKGTDC